MKYGLLKLVSKKENWREICAVKSNNCHITLFEYNLIILHK